MNASIFFFKKNKFPLLFLFIILIVFSAINIRWLWVYRHGGPLDIDEAGYLGISFADYFGFIRHGLLGFLRTVDAPGIQAPLTTAVTGLALLITGPHIFTGFIVMTLFGIATIIAAFFLAESTAGPIAGIVSALLVASCPTVIMYSRSFIFALPLAFSTAMALLSLLRSDRFRNIGWSLSFGMFCGLMPLSRTMAIAFLPGLLLGATVYLAGDYVITRHKIANLFLSILVGFATALTWFWPNGLRVFHYLLSFGYGNHASEYGKAVSIFGLEDWITVLQKFSDTVYFFDFLLLFLGAVASLAILIISFVKSGLFGTMKMVFLSNIAPLVIFVIFSTAALASSRNEGNGFAVPIVPVAIVIAGWSILRLSRSAPYRFGVFTLIAVAVLAGMLPALDLKSSLAIPRSVKLPVLGKTTVTDGRAYIELYESGGGFSSADPNQPITIGEGRRWVAFNSQLTAKLLNLGAENAVTAFGFRHRLINLNTVRLQGLLITGSVIPLTMVDPIATGNSIEGNVKWLTSGAAADACLLLTSSAPTGEIAPVVSNMRMVEAAHETGFKATSKMRMPNGEFLTIWARKSHGRNCPDAS